MNKLSGPIPSLLIASYISHYLLRNILQPSFLYFLNVFLSRFMLLLCCLLLNPLRRVIYPNSQVLMVFRSLDFFSCLSLSLDNLTCIYWDTTSSLIFLNSSSFIFLYMYSEVVLISKFMFLIGWWTSLLGYLPAGYCLEKQFFLDSSLLSKSPAGEKRMYVQIFRPQVSLGKHFMEYILYRVCYYFLFPLA